MFSYRVADLGEFEQYLQRWVELFGAETVPAISPPFNDLIDPDSGRTTRIDVEPFRPVFPTGTSLTVDLLIAQPIDGPPEVSWYAFHFQAPDRMLWRFCRNRHYEVLDGTPFHLHRADGTREAQPGPVTFRQVYEMVTLENAAWDNR